MIRRPRQALSSTLEDELLRELIIWALSVATEVVALRDPTKMPETPSETPTLDTVCLALLLERGFLFLASYEGACINPWLLTCT